MECHTQQGSQRQGGVGSAGGADAGGAGACASSDHCPGGGLDTGINLPLGGGASGEVGPSGDERCQVAGSRRLLRGGPGGAIVLRRGGLEAWLGGLEAWLLRAGLLGALLNRAWLLLGAWLTRLLKLSARDTTAAAGGASQAGAGPALRIAGALQKPPAVEIVACSQVAAEEVGEWAPSMGGGGAQQADEEKEGGEACHDMGPFSCGEEWE